MNLKSIEVWVSNKDAGHDVEVKTEGVGATE